jgi:hypothetical protein
MLRIALVVFALASGLLLSACENKEVASIAEAQHCLDKATPATAESCLSHISGDTPQAFMIRCSVRFIKEGFTTSRYVKAFKQISESKAGDATITALAFFKFGQRADMDATLADCSKSGSKGMIQLAQLADIATFVVTDMGGGAFDDIYDPDTGEVDTGKLDNLKNTVLNDSTKDEELGEKAMQLSEVLCGAGKEDTSICEDLNEAISDLGLPPDASQEDIYKAIGAKLRDLLK